MPLFEFHPHLIAFLLLIVLGSYIQTVTGFALGLIVMGSATLLQLASIEFTAVVINLVSFWNILFALWGRLHQIHRRVVVAAVVGMIPSLLLGFWLLGYLSSSASHLLRQILGLFIVAAAVLLVLRPHPRPVALGWGWDGLMGALGGIFGGLFSTAGPPLVYHLYRQPYPIGVVKSTLLAIFGVTVVTRLTVVVSYSTVSALQWTTALLAVPLVYLATWLGHHYPPPLSEIQLRRFAFLLLALLGAMLLV